MAFHHLLLCKYERDVWRRLAACGLGAFMFFEFAAKGQPGPSLQHFRSTVFNEVKKLNKRGHHRKNTLNCCAASSTVKLNPTVTVTVPGRRWDVRRFSRDASSVSVETQKVPRLATRSLLPSLLAAGAENSSWSGRNQRFSVSISGGERKVTAAGCCNSRYITFCLLSHLFPRLGELHW